MKTKQTLVKVGSKAFEGAWTVGTGITGAKLYDEQFKRQDSLPPPSTSAPPLRPGLAPQPSYTPTEPVSTPLLPLIVVSVLFGLMGFTLLTVLKLLRRALKEYG